MKYKVGDRVKVQSLERYNKYKNRYGDINYGCETEILFTSEMSSFCGQVATITRVRYIGGVRFYHLAEDKEAHLWVDGMFEGLVEEETKPEPKFKVGDRVKWYNHTCIITAIHINENTHTYLIKHKDCREDKAFGPWVPENELAFDDNEETLTKLTGKAIKNSETVVSIDEYTLPEGYQFVDENGNVINTTKIVLEKKKKEYPKTYEECEKVLRYDSHRLDDMGVTVRGYKWELIRAFQILLICRDAYWKIAGEEMGLGKPWEPDFDNDKEYKYGLFRLRNVIYKDASCINPTLLIFPTPEMRDAFYENFNELIEQCKELL